MKIKKPWLITASLFLFALLILGCAQIYSSALQNTSARQPTLDQESPSQQEDNRSPQGFSGQEQDPTRIIIEKIDLDAEILPVGTDTGNRMAVPSFGVGWYEYYASPGWATNALLAAHNTFNDVPGTFENLHELVSGDIVEFAYEDDTVGAFAVEKVDVYPVEEVPLSVMENLGDTRTTLIVCDGEKMPDGQFSHRRIVILEARERAAPDGLPLWVHTF